MALNTAATVERSGSQASTSLPTDNPRLPLGPPGNGKLEAPDSHGKGCA